MPIAISDDSGGFGEGGEDAPTERATGATFLATSTRSMPALATTFAARVVRLVRARGARDGGLDGGAEGNLGDGHCFVLVVTVVT